MHTSGFLLLFYQKEYPSRSIFRSSDNGPALLPAGASSLFTPTEVLFHGVKKGWLSLKAIRPREQISYINAFSSFTVKAILKTDKLKRDIRKMYKNSFESGTYEGNPLQVIDTALNFENKKMPLKEA
ncbi:hypothetical protein [Chitinophaga sp.]|uniref:hypothetical protein n=1 Tax=Chitinophaga sp. TaxID=1869181 RepID=UPI002F939DE1